VRRKKFYIQLFQGVHLDAIIKNKQKHIFLYTVNS